MEARYVSLGHREVRTALQSQLHEEAPTVLKEARRRALENGGRPILLEMMSYRMSHHSTSDNSFTYRNSKDLEPWTVRDNPILKLGKWLKKKGFWDD